MKGKGISELNFNDISGIEGNYTYSNLAKTTNLKAPLYDQGNISMFSPKETNISTLDKGESKLQSIDEREITSRTKSVMKNVQKIKLIGQLNTSADENLELLEDLSSRFKENL